MEHSPHSSSIFCFPVGRRSWAAFSGKRNALPSEVVNHVPRAPVSILWKWDFYMCQGLSIHRASTGRLSSKYQTVQPYAERGTEHPVGPEFRATHHPWFPSWDPLVQLYFLLMFYLGNPSIHISGERVINSRPYYSISTIISFCPSLFHVSPSPCWPETLFFWGVFQ